MNNIGGRSGYSDQRNNAGIQCGRILKRIIESILNQTEANFELIIVNDGSTDNSEDIILSYSDPRIVYVKQENAGEAAARNTALEHAKGEFIVWQDADDVSLPIRLEVLKRQFTSPSIGFTHSDMLLINDLNQPISYWQSRNISKERLLRLFLKIGTPFNNPSMMLRRKMIEGFKYDTSLRIGTDSDMVFQLSRNWDSVHIPEPLVLYRRHSNNLTVQANFADLDIVHVRKFLNSHGFEEFFPELNWENGSASDSMAKACALIGLFMARRCKMPEAEAWFERAANLVSSIDGNLFTRAMIGLVNGQPQMTVELLNSCNTRDHVIENYIGEAAMQMGQLEEAFNHFMKALEFSPHYYDAMDNLKKLGQHIGLRLV
ncbi:MAG: glycosyltransferase [Firmicutes bacterium]|nr:glycosyltransferase [Bacillota bacterium]